jgi:hypothetical protein
MTKFLTRLGFIISLSFVSVGLSGPYTSPYIDVRSYHVRAINPYAVPAIPGITASIILGGTTATLSVPWPGVNGDGVMVFGAGNPCTLTTPFAPTVDADLIEAGAGTGIVTPGPGGGTTTYNYKIIARDKAGCLTAASSVGTTSTGAASLGPQNATISGFTRSGSTVTATTTVPHGLASRAWVNIRGSTNSDNLYFGGHYLVATTDKTHFTYVTGNDVANGAPTTSGGGGTVYWANTNHLSWPVVADAFEYYIYGRTGDSLTLLGVSRVQSTINGLTPDTTWDDFGSPSMDGFVAPFFVPSTPPASPLAHPLVTAILSGAGTAKITLAKAASTTPAGPTTILFDNEPNLAIAAGQTQFGSLLYFPGNADPYVVNSYLTLPTAVAVNLAGSNILLNDTMEIQSADKLYGMMGAQTGSFLQFGYPVGGSITAGRANPAIYGGNAAWTYIYGIQISAGGNGGVGMLLDQALNSSFNYMNFASGGDRDSMSIPLIIRATDFLVSFDHVADIVAQGPFFGLLPTPALLYSGGNVTMSNLSFSGRGIFRYAKTAGPGVNVVIKGASRIQGGTQPFFTDYVGRNVEGGSITINNVELDTMPHALFANLSAGGTVATVDVTSSAGPALGFGMLTGKPVGFVVGTLSGQNNAAIAQYSFTNNPVNVTGIGEFMVPIINTVAPGVTVSAGGNVPVGTNCFAITMVDVNGQESTLGPNVCVAVTSGNQKVTITHPAVPSGAVGWLAYRGGSGGANDRISEHCFIGSAPFGTAVIDTTAFSCGRGAPTTNRAGSQSISAAGLSGTGINVLGGGFKNALSFNGTANRKTVLPDLSGSPVSTVGYDSQARKTSAQTPKSLTNPATGLTFTVGANDTLFRADVALACDLSSANATVLLTILYTDVSNTAQSQATTTANCTTLGAASVTSQAFLFMAKAGTSIQYSTNIVNMPSYDVRISLQQLGIN